MATTVTSTTNTPVLTSTLTDANKKRLDALDKDTTSNELKAKQQMGKEQFLNLITKQLSNQDPLSPMEDSQFISQMAQLQSLDTNNSLLSYAKNTYAATTAMATSLETMSANIKTLVEKMSALSTGSSSETLSTDAATIVNELTKINKAMETYFTK